MKLTEEYIKSNYILYDADYITNPAQLGFDSQSWADRNAIIGFAEGRGTTFFVQYEGVELVLRHYQRGGLIAKYSKDKYVWLGLDATRAWREWLLLAALREKGLPVPVPVACQVKRQGLFYTNDIMTLRIPLARTLADILGQKQLEEEHWSELGSIIQAFHEQGVYHADLNANNILLDEQGQFHLIDFDRGCFKRPSSSWQQANLARLKRSLDKIKANSDVFYSTEEDWKSLLQGYDRKQ
ncbi:MAG: 3-deoxy-D-manno-octulosonic acid kinase [Gammaproteobacteria bacterium]|nr:3-deoxy-D-manno-octulosonic acid kinase [Gammaproteobacteria bacterium]